MLHSSEGAPIRRSILVRGVVQGVGFRPHVHGLASRLGLCGFVQNRTDGVRIEIEGTPGALDRFEAALAAEAPPLASIDGLDSTVGALRGETTFRIEASDEADPSGPVLLSPDAATCAACLEELFDPGDRRYRYPFINCTDCGPRLTIIRAAPYDRARTAMAPFEQCGPCRAEYEDPHSRRFHAQANACADCGPRLTLWDEKGRVLRAEDPLAAATLALQGGAIVALKGLGGYHLACDATRPAVVARLRRLKQREEKPFAVMVEDAGAAEALCALSPDERALLSSPERPIVLLGRRPGTAVAEEVAPGSALLGVMLPPTPLHHLLARAMDRVPLVMTSGNRSEQPVAFDDADAALRLIGVADLFLTHDRSIQIRCDDSVARVLGGQTLLLRRSRGYAPRRLTLPVSCERPILALGGHLKATFALGRGRTALVSPHVGDLDDRRAYQAYAETIAHYERLFAFVPAVIVHDLHPGYASTAFAEQRAAAGGLGLLAVQHHHAHMASCLAEHGLGGPAIGVTFDGTGYGVDGTVWGGEFLVGDLRAVRRGGHLRPVALPGGERAVREPWRMALAYLVDAGLEDLVPFLLGGGVSEPELRTVRRMIERRVNAPLCSSMGRLFDAVAALTGLRYRTSFEGQAAMELESLAAPLPTDGAYPFELDCAQGSIVVDTRPLIRALVGDRVRDVPAAVMAGRFHRSVRDLTVAVCSRLRAESPLDTVALSGGVFQNAVLTEDLAAALAEAGFRAYRHGRVPPNDGGLSLGQLAVAAATLHPEGGD